MSSPAEVVVTGVGLCCHVGDDLDRVTRELREGIAPAFARWQPAEPYEARCHLVGLYPGELDGEARFMGRAGRMALHAARAALAQAGYRGRDLAVVVGSGTGDIDTIIDTHQKLLRARTTRRVSPTAIPRMMASSVSAGLAVALTAAGPAFGVSAACASGALNLVFAASLIREGHAEAALAGGTECADAIFHAGFEAMRAYSTDDSGPKPYAADRSGFVFGEGAGVVLLESRAAAEARGARPLGILRGFGMAGAGEMVAPSAAGTLAAMRRALANAKVSRDQIGYVNTHATGTPHGDLAEYHALRELFGDRDVAYSSIKGYTGHTVSASGAIEAILTWEMLRGGWIAPSVCAHPLDAVFADHPPVLEPAAMTSGLALSNSIGFGGTSVCVVLERPH